MRNLALTAVFIIIFVSSALAQQKEMRPTAGQGGQNAQAVAAAETATGKVDSISPIDPEEGTAEGSIEILDAAGNALYFTINTDTVLTDESYNKIDSDDIEDGDTVNITYVKSDIGSIAKSISRSKK